VSDDVPESASLARLRNAWLESTDAPDDRACLDPTWIWDAVHGRHAPESLERGLAHVAQCGACAEAWRLAHEMVTAEAPAPSRASSRGPAPAWTSWKVWLPAAAALVVFVGGTGYDRGWFERTSPGGQGNVVRGASPAIASTMGATGCDRSACTLMWSDAGAGARYDIRVTRADLEPVIATSGLTQTAFAIPAAALRTVAPGGDVFWQVDAVLPDGRRLSSPTFVLQVR